MLTKAGLKVGFLLGIGVSTGQPVNSSTDIQDYFAATFRVHAADVWASATAVPPVQDANGRWHWLAVGCAHQFRNNHSSKITLEKTYPADATAKFSGKLICVDESNDLSVIEFVPRRPVLFVHLADPAEVNAGVAAYTVGHPGGNDIRGLETTIKSVGKYTGQSGAPLVEASNFVEHGHSGGGLFVEGALVGATSAACPDCQHTFFSTAEATAAIYERGARKVTRGDIAAKADPCFGPCKRRRQPSPPYEPPPAPELPPPAPPEPPRVLQMAPPVKPRDNHALLLLPALAGAVAASVYEFKKSMNEDEV